VVYSIRLLLAVIGVASLFIVAKSVLYSLFILEVIFFSVLIRLVFCSNPIIVLLTLVIIVGSGVLGLSLFIGRVNSYGQEKRSRWLD